MIIRSSLSLLLGCLALASLPFMPAAALAADVALVVGIDEYRDDGPPKTPSPDLFACASDARAMAQLFSEMGLGESSVRLLTDDQATRQAIVDGLAWLAASCDKSGTAYFYYSGHGSTGLTDSDGDEPDGGDEGLVPCDVINPNDYFEQYLSDPELKARVDASQLGDDELSQLLGAVAARAGAVVVLLDSCHAAGASKGLGAAKTFRKEYFSALGLDPLARPWGRPPQPGGPGGGPLQPGTGAPGAPGRPPLTQPGVTPGAGSTLASGGIGDNLFYEGRSSIANLCVLAGSEPTQYSQADPELGHGSFSFAMLDAIYNNARTADLNADGVLSWFEVGSYAHAWVSQRSQQAAREAGNEELLQYPVIYNPELAAGIAVDAPTVGRGRELLDPVQLPEELL